MNGSPSSPAPGSVQATRVAVIGAGFWARFQLAGWAELPQARVVGIASRSPGPAEALAREFGIDHVSTDPGRMLDELDVDVVDVITSPGSHAAMVRLAADRGLPVMCQKPISPLLAEAEEMATYCRERGVPLAVHENFRWMTPIREIARDLRSGCIGRPFRARLEFTTGFPVFDNQPTLRQEERFILADVGVHVLDIVRFLFGEPRSVRATTARVHPDIRGEDVATVLAEMDGGVTVVSELSFASTVAVDPFPEVLVRVEGDEGTLELLPGSWLRTTDRHGASVRRVAGPSYRWADPAYAVVHAAIVPCLANLLASVRGEGEAETAAEDNLRTLRFVEAAYDSAAGGRVIEIA